jgi:hypothetical protein
LVIWLRYIKNGDADMLRIDAMLCAVMALTFPWFVYFGERVKRLERGLTEASIELEDIEDSAWRDELTGVYNRRAINVSLDEAKHRADAIDEPLSLCVIDLDHFKVSTTSRGIWKATKWEGVRAFRPGRLRAPMSSVATAARFIQILRHTDLSGAMKGGRLRGRISELELPVSRSIGALTISSRCAVPARREIMQTFDRADARCARRSLRAAIASSALRRLST